MLPHRLVENNGFSANSSKEGEEFCPLKLFKQKIFDIEQRLWVLQLRRFRQGVRKLGLIGGWATFRGHLQLQGFLKGCW
jgi:hypothetical protein